MCFQMSILEDSSVVIEFLRRREQQESVPEVFHITPDGQCITHFQSAGSRTLDILCGFSLDAEAARVLELLRQHSSPSVKSQTFALEKLPANLAAKYKYASLFVSLVRSKTPRVTLFVDRERAKCVLMESEGFEVHFGARAGAPAKTNASAAATASCGVRATFSPEEPALVKLALLSGEQTANCAGNATYSVYVGSDSALAPASSTPLCKLPEHLRTAVQLTQDYYDSCSTISRHMLSLENQLMPSSHPNSLFPITLGRCAFPF